MVTSKHFLLALQGAFYLGVLAQAQKRTGFISIDCGTSKSSYTDENTGIIYLSDSNFITSGENVDILASYKAQTNETQLWNVRSFPNGARNCYTLETTGDLETRYLIRARFLYGNYDSKARLPEFDLYIGSDLWETVKIEDPEVVKDTEILHKPSSNKIFICLAKIGSGTPFISALELRPLETYAYTSDAVTLRLQNRYDIGSATTQIMRYRDDPYDRMWSGLQSNLITLNTSAGENSIVKDAHKVPFAVMSSAVTINSTGNMRLRLEKRDITQEYYLCMYFSELVLLGANQSRDFTVYVNNNHWWGPFSPKYLSTLSVRSGPGTVPDSEGNINIWFNATNNATVNSTLPPLLNAFEIFTMLDTPGQETYKVDVTAILEIKSEYALEKESWQGDPCTPESYTWDGINCTFDGHLPPRITSLNLTSSGLKGKILPAIADLTLLHYLDLSNNELSGTLPGFLADLKYLRVLNLKGNSFQGPIPPALVLRSKSDLTLSVDDSLIETETQSSTNEKSASHNLSFRNNNFVVPLVAIVGGYLLLP